MNALNEVNKVISSVSYYTHRHNPEEEEWLTAERMAVSPLSGLPFLSHGCLFSFSLLTQLFPPCGPMAGVDPAKPYPVDCAQGQPAPATIC